MTIGSNGLQGVVSIGLAAVICGALSSCGGPVGSPVTVAERAPSVEIGAADDNEDNEWAPAGDTVVLRAPVGDTVDLTVRVLDDQGEEIAGATVSWSSSNTNVATVDSSGVMTAVGVGSVTLTARATLPASSTQSSVTGRSAAAASRASGQAVAQSEGSIAGSIDVEVVNRASRIEITPASVSFEEVGARATLTATIYDQDNEVMQPTYWAWSSADRAVATVEGLSLASGIQASVQAIGEGTTKVTLSANGSATGTASVTVAAATVRAPQPDLVVGSPSVNESAPAAGAPFTLSATVENAGERESEATTLRYYRSPNATITTSDAQEGTDRRGRVVGVGDQRGVDLADRTVESRGVLLRSMCGGGDGRVGHDEQLLGIRVGHCARATHARQAGSDRLRSPGHAQRVRLSFGSVLPTVGGGEKLR